jgi:GDP-mannose 6-dehydrogenase
MFPVLDHAQTVVIGNRDPEFGTVIDRLRNGQSFVDFVRIADHTSVNVKHDGISW